MATQLSKMREQMKMMERQLAEQEKKGGKNDGADLRGRWSLTQKVSDESISKRLADAYIRTGEVKVQYLYVFHQGYMNNSESSVSGRERAGEYAAASIKEDEIRLEANIASLTVLREMYRDAR